MRNTGRNGEKSSYLVVLLLFVGLTAFSNSMKELAQIHQLTLDAGRLIAEWSDNAVPAEIAPAIVKVEKLETCESKQSAASLELPWLETEPNAVAPMPSRSQQLRVQRAPRPVSTVTFDGDELAKLKNLRPLNFNPEQFEFRIVDDNDDSDEPTSIAVSTTMLRAKARKHNLIKLSPRDREIFLKTLNRSLNLRIAS
jgi:hypothetical protein